MPSNTPDHGAPLVLSASDATLLHGLLAANIDEVRAKKDPALEPVLLRRRNLLARLDEAIRNA